MNVASDNESDNITEEADHSQPKKLKMDDDSK